MQVSEWLIITSQKSMHVFCAFEFFACIRFNHSIKTFLNQIFEEIENNRVIKILSFKRYHKLFWGKVSYDFNRSQRSTGSH